MKVFISWSGDKSKAVGQALYDWLPNVVQAARPWMSNNDIDKGTLWRTGLAKELDLTSVSIICLTPENLKAPWIHFEAGALSKQQASTYVCTVLFNLKPIDVGEPLSQFQTTLAEENDLRKLVHSINGTQGDAAVDESIINRAFDVWWPKLKECLDEIRPIAEDAKLIATNPQASETGLGYQRDLREILEEILSYVRAQGSVLSEQEEEEFYRNQMKRAVDEIYGRSNERRLFRNSAEHIS